MYLTQKYSSVSQWPYALRQRHQGQITTDVIGDNEFTLGTMVSVLGMKRDYDQNGNIVSYSISHRGTYNEFLRYAQVELFKFSERRRVEAALEKDYRFIEKVRSGVTFTYVSAAFKLDKTAAIKFRNA